MRSHVISSTSARTLWYQLVLGTSSTVNRTGGTTTGGRGGTAGAGVRLRAARPAVEHAAGLGSEFPGGGHVALGERQRLVDVAGAKVGELARGELAASLVGADGADVGPRAEGERVTDPAAEVGQLVILTKLAGQLVRRHVAIPLLHSGHPSRAYLPRV